MNRGRKSTKPVPPVLPISGPPPRPRPRPRPDPRPVPPIPDPPPVPKPRPEPDYREEPEGDTIENSTADIVRPSTESVAKERAKSWDAASVDSNKITGGFAPGRYDRVEDMKTGQFAIERSCDMSRTQDELDQRRRNEADHRRKSFQNLIKDAKPGTVGGRPLLYSKEAKARLKRRIDIDDPSVNLAADPTFHVDNTTGVVTLPSTGNVPAAATEASSHNEVPLTDPLPSSLNVSDETDMEIKQIKRETTATNLLTAKEEEAISRKVASIAAEVKAELDLESQSDPSSIQNTATTAQPPLRRSKRASVSVSWQQAPRKSSRG